MGDSLRDELEKQRKRGRTRIDGNREALAKRSAAIAWQSRRKALRDAAKEKAKASGQVTLWP